MNKIRIHNPCNEYTRYYRNYNLFWDQFTEYLKKHFIVEENRYFEKAHSDRFPIKLQNGISNELLILECEYVIENVENGEFVIMSVSDDLTHAVLNEKSNPYLKKVLISQFSEKKIYDHVTEYMFKYSPWTYFQAVLDDLDFFYQKRLSVTDRSNIIYFKGTSLEDRRILNYIDKNIITDFRVINPTLYFENIIKHKLALSIDGRGEFCYRDVECFGIGVPIIRFEYVSKFHDPLIPNFHYISIDRPNDMDLYRLGNETHSKILEERYYDVIENTEFLDFISKNARDYYNKNFEMNNKILNTFKLLELYNWL